MKLKQRPEDFQVEELTDVQAGAEGQFALYRMTKRGWTTADAMQAVRSRWKIAPRRLSYGGLKDRHAQTLQFFTILQGPKRKLHHDSIEVEYLGQVAEAFTSRAIEGNRFDITIRDLDAGESKRAWAAIEEVRGQGVPNYFDDQRFGSASDSSKFVGRAMVLGHYEQALRLALAEPYEHDRSAGKKQKSILRSCWGHWQRCRKLLHSGQAASIVDYLVEHPNDYAGALFLLRADLRALYLSAYQSYLWNQMLARWLRHHCPDKQLVDVPLRLGKMPMHHHADDAIFAELHALRLPLPHAGRTSEVGDPRAQLLLDVLQADGIALEQLRLRGLRGMFFSKGERAALCVPRHLEAEAHADDMQVGKQKLQLRFELPRGSYATLVVKRLTAPVNRAQ